MRHSDIKRFLAKVEKTDGCWNWTAGRDHSGKGYGSFHYGGKVVGAHQFSFELHHGPIPVGLCVLHSCDNKICVRPDHLHSGTHKKNMEEAVQRGRMKPWARGITHCKRGHEFTPENTHIRKDGTGRKCRICNRLSTANTRARHQAEFQKAA